MSATDNERPSLAIKPVQPPSSMKWCSLPDVYFCRLVNEVSRTNQKKYVKRALVMTPNEVFVCDPTSGAVQRVIKVRAITHAYVQVIEVSKKMGLTKEPEQHVLLVVPTELDILLSQRTDAKTAANDPNDLLKVLRELQRCLGMSLPATYLDSNGTDSIFTYANFNAAEGYVDTQTRIKVLADGKEKQKQRVDRYSRLEPVSFKNGQDKVEKLCITSTGQLEWWEEDKLMLPSVAALSFDGTHLEAPGTGVSSIVAEVVSGSRNEFLRLLGLLAAYSSTKTSGLPVPVKKRAHHNGGTSDGAPPDILNATDGETLSVPPNSHLHVLYAEYGIPGASTTDVTEVVRSHVVDGGVTLMVRSDVLGSDPCPGQTKILSVECKRIAAKVPSVSITAAPEKVPEAGAGGPVRNNSNPPGSEDAHSVHSNGSRTYRHDPYGDDDMKSGSSVASSVSSYGYSLGQHRQYFADSNAPSDLASPVPLGSSFDSGGIPSLMQTTSDASSLSRKSSQSATHSASPQMWYQQQQPQQQPPSAHQQQQSLARGNSLSSVQTSEPPQLLSESTGLGTEGMGTSVTSQVSELHTQQQQQQQPPPPVPQQGGHDPQQWPPGYPQGVPMQGAPGMPVPMMQMQGMQQQQQPGMPLNNSFGMNPMQPNMPMQYAGQMRPAMQRPMMPQVAAPGKGFVEFTDTDGDTVRFQEVGNTIELSVNQRVLGYLKSLDYDHPTGKLVDGTGGCCVLPPARRKGLESRLAWLAEKVGVAHNIKAEAPMSFEIKMDNPQQPLGLSFEVIDDGSVNISGVTADTPCGKAGVVCGTIHLLDHKPIRSGDDLRNVVTTLRSTGRTEFTLEVKMKPKEEAVSQPPMVSGDQAQRIAQMNVKGQKGAKGAKGQKGTKLAPGSRQQPQSDALVRLFVLFKHGRRAEYASNERVSVGEHVLVESREGVDLGLVAGARLGGRKDDRYRVQRKATNEEVDVWKASVAEEETYLQNARQLVTRHATPVEIHRCDIQFDRKKVTFHFAGGASKSQLNTLTQACSSSFGMRVAMNNCQPPAGERGDPIDLSSPSIPAL
eukprot:TRINITY_DN3595_c0_g5_i2.p1 TRINITY_DN3595_c0_g5~~TRINITY_DN3595_c0_g5_i2.p1  ORF type:complete len:1060 (+),score=353.94 TRINITY_DN3595_c0_g5_i2:133-3312(+)